VNKFNKPRRECWSLSKPSDSRIWSWAPWDSEPINIVLARTSSNLAVRQSVIRSSYLHGRTGLSLVEEKAPFLNTYISRKEQKSWSRIARRLKAGMNALSKASRNLTHRPRVFKGLIYFLALWSNSLCASWIWLLHGKYLCGHIGRNIFFTIRPSSRYLRYRAASWLFETRQPWVRSSNCVSDMGWVVVN
jgi:hypothetical protein